jgi:uncharacterized protein YggE
MSRVLISTAVLCLGFSVPALAQTPDSGSSTPPVIVTMGTSRVQVAPDRAFLMLATEATAPAPTAAQQRIAQAMAAVRARLKSAKVPDDAVKTVSYSLQEDADFVNGRRVPKGYRASNAIEVRVDDVDRVGEVLDAAVQAGATTVNEIRFDLKDRDAVERQALKQAVADARARADAIAAGAGVTIASIVRIDEQGRSFPIPPPMPMRTANAAMAMAPGTPISGGEIEVQATVTLTVAIK